MARLVSNGAIPRADLRSRALSSQLLAPRNRGSRIHQRERSADPTRRVWRRLRSRRRGPHTNDSSSPLYSQVLEAVRAVPGIESAAYSFTVPVGDSGFHTGIQAEGYQPQSDHDTDVALNLVS